MTNKEKGENKTMQETTTIDLPINEREQEIISTIQMAGTPGSELTKEQIVHGLMAHAMAMIGYTVDLPDYCKALTIAHKH